MAPYVAGHSMSHMQIVGAVFVFNFFHIHASNVKPNFFAVRCSGSGVDHIKEVLLPLARLVLGWVTVSGFNSPCRNFISACNPISGQLSLAIPSWVDVIRTADGLPVTARGENGEFCITVCLCHLVGQRHWLLIEPAIWWTADVGGMLAYLGLALTYSKRCRRQELLQNLFILTQRAETLPTVVVT